MHHPAKDEGGPANPTIVAFAVADTSGRCAGAVIYGYPKTDTAAKFDSVSPCSAQGVVNAFKATFVAPTPIPTQTATTPPPSTIPGPPNTGTGASTGASSDSWELALGALALVAGGWLYLRARRSTELGNL